LALGLDIAVLDVGIAGADLVDAFAGVDGSFDLLDVAVDFVAAVIFLNI